MLLPLLVLVVLSLAPYSHDRLVEEDSNLKELNKTGVRGAGGGGGGGKGLVPMEVRGAQMVITTGILSLVTNCSIEIRSITRPSRWGACNPS